jgi:hypothetical protein
VREFVVVQELHGIAQLIRDMSYVIHGIRFVIVVLEEVEDAETENFKGDAGVAVVIEPIENLYAQTKMEMQVLMTGKCWKNTKFNSLVRRSLVRELFQRVNLEFGRLAILFHIFDDLQCHCVVHGAVFDLHHPPKSSLTERR